MGRRSNSTEAQPRPRAGRSRLRRRRRAGGLLLLLLTTAGVIGPAQAAVERPAAATSAVQQRDEAQARLDAAEARLVALEAERAVIEADHATLDTAQQALARELEVALKDTRQFAVEAYVAGGPAASAGRVLDASDVADAIWRSEVLAGQTEHGLARAGALRDLNGRADSAVRQLALRSDQNRRKVENATIERFLASVDLKKAEQRLAEERRAAEQRLAPLVVAGEAAEGSLAEAWAKLRQCESSGNYRAVSPGGQYRGAYQFDLRTWQAVGGTGDPIDASPAEQDLRAQILYDRRGRQPWPLCGRFLP